MVILRILIVWLILGEYPVIFEKDGERLLNGKNDNKNGI